MTHRSVARHPIAKSFKPDFDISKAVLTIALLATLSAFYIPSLWVSGYAGSVYIAIHLIFTGVMFIAWRWQKFSLTRLVWLGAFLRIALAFADPITSNDSERYLWDGAVTMAGFDPYGTAPNNPIVAQLREIWPTPSEHAQYPTLYPPAAIAMFSLAAAFGPEWGVWVWKAMLAGAGVASLLLMRMALCHYNQERHFALIALSPLLVLEAGVGAHLDAVLALAVSIMIWAYARSNWTLLGVALGWSVCVKLSPIVLLVPLFWALRSVHFARVTVATLGTLAVFYGAALALGFTPIGILPTFFEKWRNGVSAFAVLDAALDGHALLGAIAALAAIGMGLSAYLAARRKTALAAIIALSVPLMVSPVVFPWYLSALVPILALRPNWTILIWVSTVPITYEVLSQWLGAGVWSPQNWPLVVIAIGWVIGLALDFFPYQNRAGQSVRLCFASSHKETVG